MLLNNEAKMKILSSLNHILQVSFLWELKFKNVNAKIIQTIFKFISFHIVEVDKKSFFIIIHIKNFL